MPTFFLIAGEASGDILGARLMRALRAKLNGEVKFVGIGGPQMLAEGLDLFFPHTELMHFGVVEVLRHIPRLLKRINQTAQEVVRANPAALITIDSPDFCFRVAKRVKKQSHATIPLIHYVAPTVWAWRPGRAKKIAKFLDHLLAVLPFEPPYFTRAGLDCTFVGHSIVEGDAAKGSNAIFRSTRNIAPDTPLLTVLPGSRTGEVTHLLPIFREVVQRLHAQHPNLQIVVPTVPHLKDRVAAEVAQWNITAHIVEGERAKYDAFAASRAALACSGTVALELALARLPAVIAYKVNALTALLYRHFIRTPYANLVNIMHNKLVVPEFIQENCTAVKLAEALGVLLSDETARQTQIAELAATAGWLGQDQFVPSERAAETVLAVVNRTSPLPLAGLDAKASRLSRLVREGGTGPEQCHKIESILAESAIHNTPTSPLLRAPLPNPPHRGEETAPFPYSVLQILPALVTGGVERGTVEMTAALTKAGFRAFVASSGGPMVREVETAGGIHITLPLASKNPLTMYMNVSHLCCIIREQRIDLVHARSRAPAWSACLAASKTHTPFITTFHSAYGARSKLKRLYNSVMGKGARVIAISDFVADYAERTYGVARDVMRVIPRGVDIEKFDPQRVTPERIDALRRAWNLTSQTPVILMPGRLTRWKGQSVLIRALARSERRDFVCIIVGGGKNSRYGKELAQEIKQAGLGKNISIFDTCRDMPAAYCLADIVVVPSTRPEGFGRVVIEAQAMGSAVIASNHGGARETVIHGETGWLTTPGDALELAHTIDTILAMSPTRRRQLADRAIAHIRANFTTAGMTAKTLAVYRELLQKQ
ncbi:MAG: lipid-A-disaccharide synthase [Alphaproteobacteria bacterium]